MAERAPTLEQLEEVRRLARRYGMPVDVVDRLSWRPREVARITGLSARKVEQLIASGRLGHSKIDGAVLVPVVDVLRLLEDHRREISPKREDLSRSERVRQFLESPPRGRRSGVGS